MAKKSAGLLIYRQKGNMVEVLLVHPGGPFWAKKDNGAWSIPKGELNNDEDPLAAARREMEEETGIQVSGNFIELSPVKQKSGKWVFAWALEQQLNIDNIKSNTFEMEWPPRSGRKKSFPEIDKAGWFSMADARKKIIEGQVLLITQLEEILKNRNNFKQQ